MKKLKNLLLVLFPLAVGVFSLCVGRYTVTLSDLWELLSGGDAEKAVRTVVFNIRLPRMVLAFLAGGGLSVAGASMQSLFFNPLAAPDTIGISSAASFGAALAMLMGAGAGGVQLSALAFGVAVCIPVMISGIKKRSIMGTVLLGMVISSVFNALVSAVKYIADPMDELPAITFWLMGSMARANVRTIAAGAPFIITGAGVLILLRWRINLLMLPDEECRAMGERPHILRAVVMLCVSLVSAAVVSMCGLVGWVGLLVPHMVRALWGADNSAVIPASLFAGGGMMILADTLARCLTASEIPLSVITALAGAPVFLLILGKMRSNG